jgi:hypothetical protein
MVEGKPSTGFRLMFALPLQQARVSGQMVATVSVLYRQLISGSSTVTSGFLDGSEQLMATVKHVEHSMGIQGKFRPMDEGPAAKTALQRSLSSVTNVCGSLSSIDKTDAPQKRAKTTGQKIKSLLRSLLDRKVYIGKSSLVPTCFNLSAITRSTPGDPVSLEAKKKIDELRADCRLMQSHFERFDNKLTEEGKELHAFGEMCNIYDSVQSCLGDARKLENALGDVHSNAIGLDSLKEEYESFGKGLGNGRLSNFHNNRDISQKHIELTWKGIYPTIKNAEKLADEPSPRVAKNMGVDTVDAAKKQLVEQLEIDKKKLHEQVKTFDDNPGIHHKSIGSQLKIAIDLVQTALKDLDFDERQTNRQAHLARKDSESLLKKFAPWKSASEGQKSMLGKNLPPHQPTVIRAHEMFEKADPDLMSDTVSLSPPVVS